MVTARIVTKWGPVSMVVHWLAVWSLCEIFRPPTVNHFTFTAVKLGDGGGGYYFLSFQLISPQQTFVALHFLKDSWAQVVHAAGNVLKDVQTMMNLQVSCQLAKHFPAHQEKASSSDFQYTVSSKTKDLQVSCLLLLLFFLHLLGTPLFIDEDDGAQNGHLSTDAQERPQGSKLVCKSTVQAPLRNQR